MKHCGHVPENCAGTMLGDGSAGTDTMECCWCGARQLRPWTKVQKRVPEHGLHLQWFTRIYEEMDGDCEKRPDRRSP